MVSCMQFFLPYFVLRFSLFFQDSFTFIKVTKNGGKQNDVAAFPLGCCTTSSAPVGLLLQFNSLLVIEEVHFLQIPRFHFCFFLTNGS